MTDSDSTVPYQPAFIDLRLWDQDALVLYDWLMSVDLDAVPVTHRAEKQALLDLLNQLEQSLRGATSEEIEAARTAVAKDIGW